MPNPLGDVRGRAAWVVLGCLVCQLGLGFGYAITPLAPQILADLGWSRAWFASAQTPQAAVVSLASPLIGALVWRYGARTVLSLGAVVIGLGYGVFAGVHDWWQLAIAWTLIGLGVSGLGDITVGAVVAQWTARGRGLALGVVYTGSNLGGFLATHATFAIASAWSWRHAVGALALAAFAVLLPSALFAVRERRGAAESDVQELPEADEGHLDVAGALRTRSFWLVAISLTSFWAYLYALLNHFGLALADRGVAEGIAKAHWANAVAMGMFSKIAFGALADRMPAKAAILLDFGLVAFSSLLFVAANTGGTPGQALLWIFVLVFGFSYAARDVVTPLIIAHCFGSRSLAQIYGVLMLTLLPGNGLGGVLTGWVRDATGSYVPALAALAALNAISWLLLFAVRDERARTA